MNDQNNHVNPTSRMLPKRTPPSWSILPAPGYIFRPEVGMFYKVTDETTDPTPDSGLKCWVVDPTAATFVFQCEDSTFHSPTPPEGSVVIPKPEAKGITQQYRTY